MPGHIPGKKGDDGCENDGCGKEDSPVAVAVVGCHGAKVGTA